MQVASHAWECAIKRSSKEQADTKDFLQLEPVVNAEESTGVEDMSVKYIEVQQMDAKNKEALHNKIINSTLDNYLRSADPESHAQGHLLIAALSTITMSDAADQAD